MDPRARESGNAPPARRKLDAIRLASRSSWRGLAGEHLKAYLALRESGLDWTWVCPPRLLPGPRHGAPRISAEVFPDGASSGVPFEDVAAFIGDELEQRQFVGRRVGISLPADSV